MCGALWWVGVVLKVCDVERTRSIRCLGRLQPTSRSSISVNLTRSVSVDLARTMSVDFTRTCSQSHLQDKTYLPCFSGTYIDVYTYLHMYRYVCVCIYIYLSLYIYTYIYGLSALHVLYFCLMCVYTRSVSITENSASPYLELR